MTTMMGGLATLGLGALCLWWVHRLTKGNDRRWDVLGAVAVVAGIVAALAGQAVVAVKLFG